MKPTTVIEMRRPVTVTQLACTVCGAQAEASCDCGAPYLPKQDKAKQAIAANPEKSNVAIAKEIGVGEATVRRARGSSDDEPEKHIGLDGKSYPARRQTPPELDPDYFDVKNEELAEPGDAEEVIRRRGFLWRAGESLRFSHYDSLKGLEITPEMYVAAREAAAAWQFVALTLQGRLKDEKTA